MICDVWQPDFVKIDKDAENDELRRKCAGLEAKNAQLVSHITLIKELAKKSRNDVKPKRILKNGDYMTVLWEDGTKTIVKRAADEPESDYAAFTACLGIKCFGSNSALKRIVASAEVQNKKKKTAAKAK